MVVTGRVMAGSDPGRDRVSNLDAILPGMPFKGPMPLKTRRIQRSCDKCRQSKGIPSFKHYPSLILSSSMQVPLHDPLVVFIHIRQATGPVQEVAAPIASLSANSAPTNNQQRAEDPNQSESSLGG